MRVRTSHASDGWRDMGPTPARPRRSKADPFYASTIPDMAPVINFGGLTAMSGRPSDYRPKAELSFSIRPENRHTLRSRRRLALTAAHPDGQRRPYEDAPRCGYLMPLRQEPCARLKGHSEEPKGKGHRSRADLDARRDRKRSMAPSRKAA